MAAEDGEASDTEPETTEPQTTEPDIHDERAGMDVLVLGPVGVGPVGRPLAPTSNILRAVLAALALAGPGGLSAGELFETVWGSRDARSTDSTLTVNIHRLRQWLRSTTNGRVSITRTTTGYALDLPEGEVDADRFVRLAEAAEPLDAAAKAEALGAALALWRGPALADVPDGSANQPAVVRLELRRVTVVVDFARALLGSGQAEQAVHALSALVEEYPLDERVVGGWIEALAATGRQADALDAYERLRLRLRDEMGADPGRALSQVLTRVLRQEVAAPVEQNEPVGSGPAGGESQQPTVRTDVLVPAQLPADTYVFTGRSAALSRLDVLMRDASAAGAAIGTGALHRIAVVTGAGGIGKTSLAVHWAHRVAARFPDGQLYANLHGFSAAPPERPADVLGRFLRALGVPGGSVPVDLDEAGALYRSLLVNRRVLVVLDNAADPAQVRPLLPGAETSRVLVTSRDRLDGLVALDGAHPVGLDVLSEKESAELLACVLGAARVADEPEAVLQLVRACAGLPLALRIAAAQLVIRPERSIGGFVSRLTGGVRLDSLALGGDESSQLRAVFDLSYV
ncbi:MAG: BTAD domain-containing putative transcriptional regulator, partial [Actinocrinis sp.]